MTGYIDDITGSAAMLLFASSITTAIARQSFPCTLRLLSALALGVAATTTLLFSVFIVAAATASPPGLPRYDAYCTACAIFTFLPPQFLWLQAVRGRPLVVAVIACLSLIPLFLGFAFLRSSAAPFYFSHL